MPGSAGHVLKLLPETARVEALLTRLAAPGGRERADLVGSSNVGGGSGGRRGRFVELGGDFLKANLERRFATAEVALEAELPLEEARRAVGVYPPGRLWFLSHGADGAFWALSLAPRYEILRRRFEDGDPGAWDLYLEAFRMTFGVASRWGLALDCNPNNFALAGKRLYYVDDDLMPLREGGGMAFGVQALLRLREYATAPLEIREAFLLAFEALLDEVAVVQLLSWGLEADLGTRLLWPREPELCRILERISSRLVKERW